MHRIHSTARVHALDRTVPTRDGPDPAPPSPTANRSSPVKATDSNRVPPSRAAANAAQSPRRTPLRHGGTPRNDAAASSAAKLPPSAPPPQDTNDTDEKSAAVTGSSEETAGTEKPRWRDRMKDGCIRFAHHTKDALFHSWINVLLIFVPIGIAVNWAPIHGDAKPTIVFAMNAVAIIPLAGLLSHATESVASRMGDTWASLLNVTFGNAVELIIFIIALAKDEIRIVQASILGSILANLLLILGMSFLLGGLRFQEQMYNSTVTQMSACLLSLSVTSLLLPTAFHASFSNYQDADTQTIKISRGTSVVLLLVYILYLLFQLKSHAYMYESTPQHVIDEESHPGVLAEMMDSSSSSSSSSSDDDDSDSSTDSQNTAKKWVKKIKHRTRRKSSASSNQPTSLPSPTSSPSADHATVVKDEGPTSNEDYFTQNQRQRKESLLGSGMGGDEADTDGAPQPRDFQPIRAESSASPTKSPDHEGKRKKKSTRKHRRKHKERRLTSAAAANSDLTAETSAPRVDFAEEVEVTPTPATVTGRGPFAALRRSPPSFRPAVPSLLQNNVFVNPPTLPSGHSNAPHTATSNAREHHLRRTSSLPDRLTHETSNSRTLAARNSSTTSQRPGALAVNEMDAREKDDDEPPTMSRTAATMLLLVSTGLVAFCAELLVDSIPEMIQDTAVSQAFIGLIILPIVGNAAEHVTAVTVAYKNKMDLAIGVAVGSSIQIALFITPFVVLLGWCMDKPMSLYFNLFETISLFVTAFVVNFLVLDGRSNYLEGSLLIAAYVIIAVCAFFYPNLSGQSEVGGGSQGS